MCIRDSGDWDKVRRYYDKYYTPAAEGKKGFNGIPSANEIAQGFKDRKKAIYDSDWVQEAYDQLHRDHMKEWHKIDLDDLGSGISPFPQEPASDAHPGIGADDGDELAWGKPPDPNEKQGRATHMNIINYYSSGGSMGAKPEGWTEQDVRNYMNKF